MTASRVRGRLEKIFAYAINENLYIGNNPASWKGNLDLFLPPANKCNSTQHFKSLSFTELKAIIPNYNKRVLSGQKPCCSAFLLQPALLNLLKPIGER